MRLYPTFGLLRPDFPINDYITKYFDYLLKVYVRFFSGSSMDVFNRYLKKSLTF